MRILSKLPDAPEGWLVMSPCTFCDEVKADFLILEHEDINSLAVICSDCIRRLAEKMLERMDEASRA